MAEDLGQEDVVGLVSGFKLVAADSSVSAAEVAGFPGFVQRAEGGGNVLGQLRAGGGVDGIGAREGFQGPELIESADDLFWIGQNGNRVRLEAGAGGVAGFELAVEDECEEGEFPGRQTEAGAKEDLGRPASKGHGRLRCAVARAAALPLRCLARLASCRYLRWFSRTF